MVNTKTRRTPAGLFPSIFQIFLSLLWGGNNVSIKSSLIYGSPLQVGWIRFVLGGIVTVLYMGIRKESFKLQKFEMTPLAILGVIFSTQIVFMNFGQHLTSAGHATALNATYPIWAAIIAHFIVPNDQLSRWKILAIVFSYVGVLAILFGDRSISSEGISISGDLMSLISSCLLGLRLVLMSNFMQNISVAKVMLGQLVIGSILFLPASYALESPVYSLEPSFWLAMGYQGLVIAGFGFLANAWLIQKHLPTTITFFSFIQPPAGVILAWLVLSEDPGQGLISGLILVVTGALIFGGESYLKGKKRSSDLSNKPKKAALP